MESVYYVLTAWAGLVFGSFLNVVIVRLPKGAMFKHARSVCPHCGEPIRWYHNIPVLSFVALRGKCAHCRKSISWRYPLVEVLNAGLWMVVLWYFGLTWYALGLAFLVSGLLAIFFIDLDHQIIPDAITLPGIALGVGLSFLPQGVGIVDSLIGLAAGGGGLLAIALLGDWLFKKESMGGGDIKMAAMLGAFVGWQRILLIFIGSAVVGLVVSIAMLAFSSKLRKTRMIPFGPFLAMAAMIAILWGQSIIHFYAVNFIGIR